MEERDYNLNYLFPSDEEKSQSYKNLDLKKSNYVLKTLMKIRY
jgi:hypothetical protein